MRDIILTLSPIWALMIGYMMGGEVAAVILMLAVVLFMTQSR